MSQNETLLQEPDETGATSNLLLQGFRFHYNRLKDAITTAAESGTDPGRLSRIGDDLDEYINLVREYEGLFEAGELHIIQENLTVMQSDIRTQYHRALDDSHQGHPTVIDTIHSGLRGQPRIWIDPEFLRWAYSLRSTSGIARFLGVSRRLVRNLLLEHGIAQPQATPSAFRAAISQTEAQPDDFAASTSDTIDQLLEPSLSEEQMRQIVGDLIQQQILSYTGPVSDLSDAALDELIASLRLRYQRAGLSSLDGMIRASGYRISRERIRQSLLRIDPIRRVFERITIRRRVYSVPGPNSLWHHDGQHGLIHWGIVIHGFIDGYSRLITGLRASDNNRSQTVLDVFLEAANIWRAPSRLRGDHGTENLLPAAWMERENGEGRGSYIWGRSVHNIRIERLWVDVTIQVTAKWKDRFRHFELSYGLDINNPNHIWLLHLLFLSTINGELDFFAKSWNQHKIQIRDGPNRSPADMFGFDMLVHGIRGHRLSDSNDMSGSDNLSEAELEVFGVDWEGLEDNSLLLSRQLNNPNDEEPSSWIGRRGPPENLSEVRLEAPDQPVSHDEAQIIYDCVSPWIGCTAENDINMLWHNSLLFARSHFGNSF